MSLNVEYMNSHSGLERELNMPKHLVLVDAQFAGRFIGKGIKTTPFEYLKIKYAKVPTMQFVNLGGIFKNFSR